LIGPLIGCEERTAEEIVSLAEAHGIRIISLMHVGCDGTLKLLDFAPRDPRHLRDILEGGERADGSSLFAGSGIETRASDVLLRPRPGRAFLDPFSELPTLCVMCGHASPDGSPLPESPDTILHRAHGRLLETTGVDLWALGEVEFFLGRKPQDGDVRADDEGGYQASAPVVFGQQLRREALSVLAQIGVPIKYAHSEVGYLSNHDADGCIWEQHEIELALTPLPQAAEAIVLAQWVLRNLASRAGMRVSFDPILKVGHAGSGLHIHFSPRLNGRDMTELFAGNGLPEPAQWLIAGLVEHAGALMAFGNRVPDSFVRLMQGKEAPSAVTWGWRDRKALIRIPALAVTEAGRSASLPTIEFRLPDGSAHPYLLLAGVSQAMMAGRAIDDIEALLERTTAAARGDGGGAQSLPATFREVAGRLERQRAALEAGQVFPVRWIEMLLQTLRS
jgi:glutamine synthetase